MKLSEKLDLAKRVLNLAELCRNMETSHEQILPFVPPGVEGTEDATIHGMKEGDMAAPEDEPTEEDAIMEGKSLKSIKDSMTVKHEMPPAHQSSA